MKPDEPKCDLCGNPKSWHEGKNAARRGVHDFVPRDSSAAKRLAIQRAAREKGYTVQAGVPPSPEALEFAHGFFASGILFRLDEIAAFAKEYDPAVDPPVLAALAGALDHFAQLRHDEDIKAARNLVAVLNGDGGHHQGAVGFVQACKDATARYYDLVTKLDALGQEP